MPFTNPITKYIATIMGAITALMLSFGYVASF
jgi:hypothetical protein